MTDAYIFDHVRTPRGKGKPSGALHSTTSIALAKQVLNALAMRNQLNTSLVDDVVMGNVSPIGEQGANIARIAALAAGFDQQVAGVQVNRFCASGLEACNMGAAQLMSGQSQLVVAGGVESMSRVPMGSDGGAWAIDPAVASALNFVPQGIGADVIASLFGYSREDVDRYAVESHVRASNAWQQSYFAKSVIPVTDLNGVPVLTQDELIRNPCRLADLSSLAPAFAEQGRLGGFDELARHKYPILREINHVHHAGNSSGIADGAAAVLMGSLAAGQQAGLTPRARIRGFAVVGSEPTIMLTGPSFAAEKALKNAGMVVGDIDRWELNEAFASVVLRFMDVLSIDHSIINVNGGAIAMGHPLGATGAMILGTVLDELERKDLSTGLATLCVGAGMGIATIIERV